MRANVGKQRKRRKRRTSKRNPVFRGLGVKESPAASQERLHKGRAGSGKSHRRDSAFCQEGKNLGGGLTTTEGKPDEVEERWGRKGLDVRKPRRQRGVEDAS